MLFRGTLLLTVLIIIDVTQSRHIDRDEKDSGSTRTDDTSRHSKRQLQRVHLRIQSKPPRTLHVRKGDTEFLECLAGGSPAPTLHWLKNGQMIPQSGSSSEISQLLSNQDNDTPRRNQEIGFTYSRLYLDCLAGEDEAEYSCVAENPYQRTSATTKVTVSSTDDEISCTKDLNGHRPRIHHWTKTMIGIQGQQSRLQCRANGSPRPTTRWLDSNQEELGKDDTSKYEILPSGDLIIRNMDWNDMGKYTCIVENIHGESSIEAFLYPAMPEP